MQWGSGPSRKPIFLALKGFKIYLYNSKSVACCVSRGSREAVRCGEGPLVSSSSCVAHTLASPPQDTQYFESVFLKGFRVSASSASKTEFDIANPTSGVGYQLSDENRRSKMTVAPLLISPHFVSSLSVPTRLLQLHSAVGG